MWVWMQAYVKIQELTYGDTLFVPKLRTAPAVLMNPVFGQHKFLEIPNITVHYVTRGCEDKRRPLLLLLHGVLDFWFVWDRQIPELSKEFCVVAPDMRGYGKTSKPPDSADYMMTNLVEDVKNMILNLNPRKERKVVLVGHGWGGMTAFCFTTLHEDLQLIDKMVIINGMHPKAFGKQLRKSLVQKMMAWYFIPFQKPVVPEKYLIMHDFEFLSQIHGTTFSPEEEYAAKYTFSKPGALTAALNYYRAFNNDSEQLEKFIYRTSNVSTLILWGENDAFLSAKVAKYNRKWLASSTVVYYPEKGHWLLKQCSVQVNARIRDFVKDGSLDKSAVYQTKGATCTELMKVSSKKEVFRGFPGVPKNASVPSLYK